MNLLNFYKKNLISFTITVSGNCMYPLLKDGDVVQVCPSEKYSIGDIVVCTDANGVLYIHRIHKIIESKYITKADNNICEDAVPVYYDMVYGKALIH